MDERAFPGSRRLLISPHRVEHRDDVLGGDIGHDVMDLLEDEPAAWGEDFHLLSDMRADLLGCAVGQDFPGVAAATPESQVLAELALQLRGVHPAAGDLDRVDGVEPRLDEVRQKRADPFAAMKHDLDPGQSVPWHASTSRHSKNSRYIAGDIW